MLNANGSLTCPDFTVSIFTTADSSTSNDRQLAFGQSVHVGQGCSGQVQQGLSTEASYLHPAAKLLAVHQATMQDDKHH